MNQQKARRGKNMENDNKVVVTTKTVYIVELEQQDEKSEIILTNVWAIKDNYEDARKELDRVLDRPCKQKRVLSRKLYKKTTVTTVELLETEGAEPPLN